MAPKTGRALHQGNVEVTAKPCGEDKDFGVTHTSYSFARVKTMSILCFIAHTLGGY